MEALVDSCRPSNSCAEIKCVISNNPDAAGLHKAASSGVQTHVVDQKKFQDRSAFELELTQLLLSSDIDLICLAGFMSLLSSNFVSRWHNKIINIHHSFLPAFIGANPYKQAYDRGVKIIGATAHFVNNNLDDGPIIEQDVIRVNHEMSWEEMRIQGRDIEKIVLSRAIKLAIEDRIFVYANKTIIL